MLQLVDARECAALAAVEVRQALDRQLRKLGARKAAPREAVVLSGESSPLALFLTSW